LIIQGDLQFEFAYLISAVIVALLSVFYLGARDLIRVIRRHRKSVFGRKKSGEKRRPPRAPILNEARSLLIAGVVVPVIGLIIGGPAAYVMGVLIPAIILSRLLRPKGTAIDWRLLIIQMAAALLAITASASTLFATLEDVIPSDESTPGTSVLTAFGSGDIFGAFGSFASGLTFIGTSFFARQVVTAIFALWNLVAYVGIGLGFVMLGISAAAGTAKGEETNKYIGQGVVLGIAAAIVALLELTVFDFIKTQHGLYSAMYAVPQTAVAEEPKVGILLAIWALPLIYTAVSAGLLLVTIWVKPDFFTRAKTVPVFDQPADLGKETLSFLSYIFLIAAAFSVVLAFLLASLWTSISNQLIIVIAFLGAGTLYAILIRLLNLDGVLDHEFNLRALGAGFLGFVIIEIAQFSIPVFIGSSVTPQVEVTLQDFLVLGLLIPILENIFFFGFPFVLPIFAVVWWLSGSERQAAAIKTARLRRQFNSTQALNAKLDLEAQKGGLTSAETKQILIRRTALSLIESQIISTQISLTRRRKRVEYRGTVAAAGVFFGVLSTILFAIYHFFVNIGQIAFGVWWRLFGWQFVIGGAVFISISVLYRSFSAGIISHILVNVWYFVILVL
jgi:hypothetical protein